MRACTSQIYAETSVIEWVAQGFSKVDKYVSFKGNLGIFDKVDSFRIQPILLRGIVQHELLHCYLI